MRRRGNRVQEPELAARRARTSRRSSRRAAAHCRESPGGDRTRCCGGSDRRAALRNPAAVENRCGPSTDSDRRAVGFRVGRSECIQRASQTAGVVTDIFATAISRHYRVVTSRTTAAPLGQPAITARRTRRPDLPGGSGRRTRDDRPTCSRGQLHVAVNIGSGIASTVSTAPVAAFDLRRVTPCHGPSRQLRSTGPGTPHVGLARECRGQAHRLSGSVDRVPVHGRRVELPWRTAVPSADGEGRHIGGGAAPATPRRDPLRVITVRGGSRRTPDDAAEFRVSTSQAADRSSVGSRSRAGRRFGGVGGIRRSARNRTW